MMSETALTQRRRLTHADILPLAEYAAIRREERRRLGEIKRRRRLEVGPYSTFSFENWATMRHQVQEMLFIEKGGDAQIEDELAAYNPLIPNGHELVATVMLEIDDPVRRAAALVRLGGIEHSVFLDIDGERVRGEPDPTRENTSPEGKASAVQFLRFRIFSRTDRTLQDPGSAHRGRLRSPELRAYGADVRNRARGTRRGFRLDDERRRRQAAAMANETNPAASTPLERALAEKRRDLGEDHPETIDGEARSRRGFLAPGSADRHAAA